MSIWEWIDRHFEMFLGGIILATIAFIVFAVWSDDCEEYRETGDQVCWTQWIGGVPIWTCVPKTECVRRTPPTPETR